MDLTDPTAFAIEIAELLRRHGTEHALYGGLLLAAYGQARETKDADLAVARGDAPATAALLSRHTGLDCRAAFDRRPFGGVLVGHVTVIGGDELNTLDLVEPVDPGYAARAMTRAVTTTLRGREIRVLSPEDFVLFKVLSSRDLDRRDASSVVRALGPELDRSLLEREVDALERSIPSHPVRDRWEQVQGLV